MSKTVNNVFYYTIGSLIKALTSFLLLPIFANILGAAQFGVLNLLQTFSSVLAILMTFGIERSLYRLYYDYKSDVEKNRFLSTLFWSINVTSLIIIIVSLGCAGYLSSLLGGVDAFKVIVPVILYTFIQALINYSQIIMQVEQEGKPYLLVSILLLVMYNVCSLLFLFLYDKTYEAMVYGNLIANAIVLPFAYFRIRNRIKFAFDFTILKSTIEYSFPLLLMALFAWALNMSDRLFLANYSDLTSLGLYSMGSKIVSVMILFDGAIFQAYGPYFFSLANNEKEDVAKAKIKVANDTITLVIGFFAIVMVIFTNPILYTVLKPEYQGCLIYVYLLTLGRIVGQQTGLLNPMIYQNKKTKEISMITICCAFISISLNRLLIPSFGPNMAAVTNLVASFFMFTMTLFYARKNFYIKINPTLIFGSILMVLICYVVDLYVGSVVVALLLKIALTFIVFITAIKLHLFDLLEIKGVIEKIAGPIFNRLKK